MFTRVVARLCQIFVLYKNDNESFTLRSAIKPSDHNNPNGLLTNELRLKPKNTGFNQVHVRTVISLAFLHRVNSRKYLSDTIWCQISKRAGLKGTFWSWKYKPDILQTHTAPWEFVHYLALDRFLDNWTPGQRIKFGRCAECGWSFRGISIKFSAMSSTANYHHSPTMDQKV